LILLPIAFTRGGLGTIGGRWPALLAFTAVEVGLPWYALSSAEVHLSSALSGLLISAVPLVSVVIATAMGNREHLRPGTLSGLAAGLVGVALIVGFDLRASDWTALLEIAVVVVGYALGPVILSRYLTGIPSVTVIGSALALCCVAYSPLAALHWPGQWPSVNVVGAIAILTVLCTAIAFLLFFALIAEIGPVRATVFTYVNPAVAALAGVAVLHESLTAGMAVGFVLVLAGSVLATRKPRQPVAAPAARSSAAAEVRSPEAL
jgi:drug/metabolite transporter (DMT)-like permease